jgi:hypothetical protein
MENKVWLAPNNQRMGAWEFAERSQAVPSPVCKDEPQAGILMMDGS